MSSEESTPKCATWLPCTKCGDDSTYRAAQPAGPRPCNGCGAHHAIVREDETGQLGLLVVERSDWRGRLRDRNRAQAHAPGPEPGGHKRKRKRVRGRRRQ